MKRLLILLGAITLAAGAALAQTPPAAPAPAATAPATAALSARRVTPLPVPQREITTAIVQLEAERLGACPGNDRFITRIGGGESPYRLATERRIHAGGVKMYRYTYRVSGCGRPPRRHNIEIYAHEGLAPMVLTLPIGTTALTTNVLDGVFNSIFTPMMLARYPACLPRQLKILEANLATGTPYVNGHPWTERWRYDACGAQGVADITFTYDGEGLRTAANVTPDGGTPAPPHAGRSGPQVQGPPALHLPPSTAHSADPGADSGAGPPPPAGPSNAGPPM